MPSSTVPKTWYIYILRCSDGSLYTGTTPNIEQRIIAHNSGKGAKYTSARRPIQLVYSEKLLNRSAACKREAEIKKLSRSNKLALISSRKKDA